MDTYMHRLTVIGSLICCALAAGACGSSSTGPKDTFAGTWVGYISSDTVRITATQTGSAFVGSGTIFNGGSSEAITFNGTSTPPTLNATLAATGVAITYAGTYVTPDSIAGTLTGSGGSAPFSLKKQ